MFLIATLLRNMFIVLVIICSCLAINITSILKKYDSVCGDLLCSKHQVVRNIPNYSKDWEQCPDCNCDLACVQSGNCCPDLFFSLRLKCVDRTIVELPVPDNMETTSNHGYTNTPPVLMVNACPHQNKLTENRKCKQPEDKITNLQNLPVTSNKTGLIYRNIHCLKCNNESINDAVSWTVWIKCQNDSSMVYFNCLSVYTEIIEMAKIKSCGISYVDTTGSIHNSRICKSDKLQDHVEINTCNVSGTWQHYDPDIDVACQTYDNKYNVFKNIFCYMCNPPPFNTADQHKIFTCNVTGMWEPYNSDLEKACLETEPNEITGKFKNIYCYLCNKNNYIFENSTDLKFKDATIGVTEYTLPYLKEFGFQFMTILKIQNFSLQEIITKSSSKGKGAYISNATINSTIHLHKPENKERNISEWIKSSNASLAVSMDTHNMLDIYKKYFAFTGIALFCNNHSTFENITNCSCDNFCRFENGPLPCCVEKNFEAKTTCTSSKYSETDKRYIVHNSCKNSSKDNLKKLCNNGNHGIFSFLPVTLTTSNFTIHYKNIFCYFCTKDPDDDFQNDIAFTFWDITLKCKTFMPLFYHFTFKRFIKFAQKNGCFVYIQSRHRSNECPQPKYKTCNVTGNLRTEDDNIRWACAYLNEIGETQNEFCKMCNPLELKEIKFRSCNKTGLWEIYDENIENNCIRMPEIEYHAPYKNMFCKICNNANETIIPRNSMCQFNCVLDMNESLFFRPTYRSLFSLFNSWNYDRPESQIGVCSSSQFYSKSKKKCLDLICYPGRILQQNRCVPLLTETYNLGYILSLELTTNSSTEITNTPSFLQTIYDRMYYQISILLPTCSIFLEWNTNPYNYLGRYQIPLIFESSFYSLKRRPKHKHNDSIISILLNQKIACLNKVNRSQIEDKLLSLTESAIVMYFSGEMYSFNVFMNAEALSLPKELSEEIFNNMSTLTRQTHDMFPFYAHVTELLRCKQVELKEHEYSIDNDTLNLTFKTHGFQISGIEYAITPSNTVRVCATHYRKLFESYGELSCMQYILGLLSMICTCLSIACLCVTFISYLMFPILRTLPGKNNMALITAMIFAHSLFQFGLNQMTSNICVYIGILIHYFWLAKFLCLSVCSFHMFRVFRNFASMIHHHEQSKQMRTFLLYLLFSYGVPLGIVTFNIIFTSTLENKLGYGGNLCFLNQQFSIIMTFLSPIMLCCLFNVFCFVLTTKNISTTINKKENQTESYISEFSIYIRLFTITGISWIFQIMDSFLPNSKVKDIFMQITSFLNALQGVFIFVAYICNRKVFKLYQQKFRLQGSKRESTIQSRPTSYEVEGNSNNIQLKTGDEVNI